MISFFQRIFKSKIGTFISLLILALIAFAMVSSDNLGSGAGGIIGGGNAVKIGGRDVSVAELRTNMLRAYQSAKQDQPGLDQATFIKNGGFDNVLKDMLNSYTLEEYARQLGLGVSKRLVDARIAETQAFQGIDGKFSATRMEQVLQDNGLTEPMMRQSIERELLIQQLLSPVVDPVRVPASFARPYGDLMLEERSGLATFLPSAYYAPAGVPTDAQLTDYVTKNRARYLIPEQRFVRYALFDKSNASAATAVTDADIAKVYEENKAKFAGSSTRQFSQVILGDEAQAKALATKASGASLADAASAIGLSASTINAKTEAELAASSSAAVAKAGFAASEGGVVGPIKVPLGWSIVKLDKIVNTPAKSLAEARPEIEKELTELKSQEAIGNFFNKLQDAANNGASVEEIARQNGLTVVTTPAILANGRAAANAEYKPDATVQAFLPTAFQSSASGEAHVVPVKDNEQFAIVDAARIIPAAVPALDTMKARVTDDWKRAEGARKAREMARKISDRVGKGETLEAAIKAEGARTEPVQRISGKRMQVTNAQGRVPPELVLLFSMAPKTSKTLELNNNTGWMVLYLDQSKRGDATKEDGAIPAIQGQLSNVVGDEYAQQVMAAARKAVGVKRNEQAINALKAEMSGTNKPVVQ